MMMMSGYYMLIERCDPTFRCISFLRCMFTWYIIRCNIVCLWLLFFLSFLSFFIVLVLSPFQYHIDAIEWRKIRVIFLPVSFTLGFFHRFSVSVWLSNTHVHTWASHICHKLIQFNIELFWVIRLDTFTLTPKKLKDI